MSVAACRVLGTIVEQEHAHSPTKQTSLRAGLAMAVRPQHAARRRWFLLEWCPRISLLRAIAPETARSTACLLNLLRHRFTSSVEKATGAQAPLCTRPTSSAHEAVSASSATASSARECTGLAATVPLWWVGHEEKNTVSQQTCNVLPETHVCVVRDAPKPPLRLS